MQVESPAASPGRFSASRHGNEEHIQSPAGIISILKPDQGGSEIARTIDQEDQDQNYDPKNSPAPGAGTLSD